MKRVVDSAARTKDDRKQADWSVGRAAWALGLSIREYQELEHGERVPSWETWDRICTCPAGLDSSPRVRSA